MKSIIFVGKIILVIEFLILELVLGHKLANL